MFKGLARWFLRFIVETVIGGLIVNYLLANVPALGIIEFSVKNSLILGVAIFLGSLFFIQILGVERTLLDLVLEWWETETYTPWGKRRQEANTWITLQEELTEYYSVWRDGDKIDKAIKTGEKVRQILFDFLDVETPNELPEERKFFQEIRELVRRRDREKIAEIAKLYN